jgi:hypothetical protein
MVGNPYLIALHQIRSAGVLLATIHDTLPRKTSDFRETQVMMAPNRLVHLLPTQLGLASL